MSEENLDLDAMINNPFRSVRPRSDTPVPPGVPRPEVTMARPENQPETPPALWREHISVAQSESEEARAERNHPLGLRMLSLEKNEFIVAKKLDDLRRIIEHQNERIRLLEEELEIFRKAAGSREE